jgi:Cu2+-exporting ATPase
VWFSANGALLARFSLREALRWDARAELATLREEGYSISILSGDAPERVATAAAQLGLMPGQAVGGLSPQGKADWLREHGGAHNAILVGDGVNDHPGFDVALCSGTPAVEHPALSSRADFYFLTAGVGCVRTALHAAHQLRRTVKNVRAIALTYNVLSVAACMAGWVSPVLAAIAMPASSILILLYTVRSSRFEDVAQASSPAGIPAGNPVVVSS